jgi:hypothetical protein
VLYNRKISQTHTENAAVLAHEHADTLAVWKSHGHTLLEANSRVTSSITAVKIAHYVAVLLQNHIRSGRPASPMRRNIKRKVAKYFIASASCFHSQNKPALMPSPEQLPLKLIFPRLYCSTLHCFLGGYMYVALLSYLASQVAI